MWVFIGLVIMILMLIISLNIATKYKKTKYIIYGSGLFLPALIAIMFLYALLFQHGDINQPIFGVSDSFWITIGFSGSSFPIEDVVHFVWYGQFIFAFGAVIFFWCIMCAVLSFLILLSGGDVKATKDLFTSSIKDDDD